jgi:hypothetical protein
MAQGKGWRISSKEELQRVNTTRPVVSELRAKEETGQQGKDVFGGLVQHPTLSGTSRICESKRTGFIEIELQQGNGPHHYPPLLLARSLFSAQSPLHGVC